MPRAKRLIPVRRDEMRTHPKTAQLRTDLGQRASAERRSRDGQISRQHPPSYGPALAGGALGEQLHGHVTSDINAIASAKQCRTPQGKSAAARASSSSTGEWWHRVRRERLQMMTQEHITIEPEWRRILGHLHASFCILAKAERWIPKVSSLPVPVPVRDGPDRPRLNHSNCRNATQRGSPPRPPRPPSMPTPLRSATTAAVLDDNPSTPLPTLPRCCRGCQYLLGGGGAAALQRWLWRVARSPSESRTRRVVVDRAEADHRTPRRAAPARQPSDVERPDAASCRAHVRPNAGSEVDAGELAGSLLAPLAMAGRKDAAEAHACTSGHTTYTQRGGG